LVFFLNFAQDAARIAGGEQAGVLMLGNADQDQLRSGDASEPNVTHVSLILVSKARPVETAAVAPTRAVEALAPTDAAEAMQPDDALVPSEEASAEPETAAAPEAIEASSRSTVTEEAKPVQPVEETITPPKTPSLPQRVAERPSPAKREKPVEERHRETSSKAAKHLDRERSTPARGSHGKDNADQRKGRAEGAENRRRAMASSGAAASSEGNAAVSNYPGKIVRKLRRALRYPRGAGSRRLHGVAEVRFVVSAGGGVGGIHLVASSGSPVLDKAALEAVRRAAPFPPIPAEAGRSNWPFTVPLAFVR
jgi:protein TonB